jgi:hypothetical protein
VRINKDGKQVFAIEGHTGTVFTARDDVLSYADFSPA